MLKPLQPGDRIALVAPASPFDAEKFDKVCGILERRGFRLSPGRHVTQRNGYLAGTEAERSEDLINAICNTEVSAVFCVRGGYGSSRLLPWLPFPTLSKNPKIFLGHSDITFLHLAFQSRMGWATFHGPNIMDMAQSPQSMEDVLNALSGEHAFSWQLQETDILRHGVASGYVVGGNLTCLVHLMGTPYFPDLTGALLAVEDCQEALYRLDRLFTQLSLAGILERLAGLLVGQFKDCGEIARIYDLVLERTAPYGLPIVAGLPFGHMPVNEVIPLGIPFSLNTYERTLQATRNPFLP